MEQNERIMAEILGDRCVFRGKETLKPVGQALAFVLEFHNLYHNAVVCHSGYGNEHVLGKPCEQQKR